MFALTEKNILVDDLLAATPDPAAGATVLFLGTTRNHNEGRDVEELAALGATVWAERACDAMTERCVYCGTAQEDGGSTTCGVVHDKKGSPYDRFNECMICGDCSVHYTDPEAKIPTKYELEDAVELRVALGGSAATVTVRSTHA